MEWRSGGYDCLVDINGWNSTADICSVPPISTDTPDSSLLFLCLRGSKTVAMTRIVDGEENRLQNRKGKTETFVQSSHEENEARSLSAHRICFGIKSIWGGYWSVHLYMVMKWGEQKYGEEKGRWMSYMLAAKQSLNLLWRRLEERTELNQLNQMDGTMESKEIWIWLEVTSEKKTNCILFWFELFNSHRLDESIYWCELHVCLHGTRYLW